MTIADFFNAPNELRYGDEVFRIREPDQLEQGEFQRWLEDLALNSTLARTYPRPEDRDAALRVWQQDCAAGVYEWGGVMCLRRLADPNLNGLAKFLEIVCRDQGVTPEKARAVAKHAQLQLIAILNKQAADDPKAVEAATAGVGLPRDFCTSSCATPRSEAPPTSPPSPGSATPS